MSMTFADLGVTGPVRAALAARGIASPFPVQELVLPVAMRGRDVLVSSPTGSGKTLAFGLPLIRRLGRGGGGPAALVLAPTRELARQIDDELTPLAAAAGLRVAVAYGGVGLDRQATKAARADILVATPGRLIDLVRQGRVRLSGVEALVLDEADRMLDMGFLPQVMSIVRELPTDRQTMFFSATLDGDVGRAAAQLTRSPERLRVREGTESRAPLGDRLDHSFVACTAATRTETLLGLIGAEDDLVLVFCRTRRGAERLSARLTAAGIAAASMHGNLSQAQRERALRRFTTGAVRVLVATDVAARGIDLDDIGLVINFDPPGRPRRLHPPRRAHRARRSRGARGDHGDARARRRARPARGRPRPRRALERDRVRRAGAAGRPRLAAPRVGVRAGPARATPAVGPRGPAAGEPRQARRCPRRRLRSAPRAGLTSRALEVAECPRTVTTRREDDMAATVTEGLAGRIAAAVMEWPGVTAEAHSFGGIEFRLGRRELGHVHGDRLADIPFPKRVRDELLKAGRVRPHHVLPQSGWASRTIGSQEDADDVVALLRVNYDRAVAAAERHRGGGR